MTTKEAEMNASERTSLGGLESRVSRLEEGLVGLRQGQTDQSGKLDRIEAALHDRGRTNWPPILSAVTLVVTILGGLGAMVSANIKDRLTTLGMQTSDRTSRNERALLSLDETLQREMRLLDERLQNEFNARIERAQGDADKALHDLASRSGRRFNREDYDKYVAPEIASLGERIRALHDVAHGRNRFTREDWESERAKLMKVLEQRGAWILEHESSDATRNATQDARIEALRDRASAIEPLVKSVSKLEVKIGKIESEQDRRTARVYSGKE